MISLFTKYNHIEMPTIKDSKLRYIRNRFNIEIKKVKEYYRLRNGKLSNNNILVRLLKTVAPDYNRDIFTYSRLLDATVEHYTKTFDIVSNISKGKVHDSILFGDNSKEVFIYKENIIDLLEVEDNWRDLVPIKVIRHDMTNTALVMPSKDIDFILPTLIIYQIDIRMLAIQYKYWSLNRLRNDFSTDPAHFLYSFVLPNMIDGILDIAIMNRMININDELFMSENINRHPFNIIDINNHIDSMLRNILKHVKYENKHYSNILKNIHIIKCDNMHEYLLNSDTGNKQSKWAYILTYTKYMLFLLEISNKKTFARNKDILNELRILFKIIKRERIMDNVDEDILLTYEINMNTIKEIIK